MNSLFKILLKVIIVPFYRNHAGLLFLVFYVMFGMVESGQLISFHRALIEGMFSSLFFTACIFTVWSLYSIKFLLFSISLLREPDHTFVNYISLLPQVKSFSVLFLINCIALLPVLCYSIFIYQVGLTQQYYIISIYIFLFQVALSLVNAWVILTYLKTQHVFTWLAPSLRLPSFGTKIGFYASYFVRDEKIALFLSKIFSLTLLYFVKENTSDGDDFRIAALALLFALSSHTFLILKIRTFEDRFLSWSRALPISIPKTYLLTFTFYTLLLCPEFLMLTTDIGETMSLLEFITLILFSGSFMMLIHAYLLKLNRNVDRFSIYLFWLFMISFFVILSKLIILLTIIFCISSYLMISKRYYKYEPLATE